MIDQVLNTAAMLSIIVFVILGMWKGEELVKTMPNTFWRQGVAVVAYVVALMSVVLWFVARGD